MRKLVLLLVLPFLMVSCSIGVKQIGSVNMISNRNIAVNNIEYEEIKSWAGSSSKKEIKREYKKVKAKSIDEAVTQTVKNTPGGEFITNAKIYVINGSYFVVTGDVWGVKKTDRNYKGFKEGDKVQYTRALKKRTGTITSLKDGTEATIFEDETEKYFTIPYDKLLKVSK